MMKMSMANNPTEAIELINHYEEIIRTQHKRVIQYIYKQEEILKMLKENENFFDGSEQNRLTIYFKIAVYFRNNLKSLTLVCKRYLDLFSR